MEVGLPADPSAAQKFSKTFAKSFEGFWPGIKVAA
jgi:hypothetical protein